MNHPVFQPWNATVFLQQLPLKTQVVFTPATAWASLQTGAAGVLSKAEWTRAARFLRSEDRNIYLLTRLVLRQLLAIITGMGADQVRFGTIANGKPCCGHQPFNITHTRSHLYIAFSPAAVGIDTERIDPAFDAATVMENCFSTAEKTACALAPSSSTFFEIWTRKEALLKATGEGLCDALQQVAVTTNRVRRQGCQYHLATCRHQDHVLSYATEWQDEQAILWQYA